MKRFGKLRSALGRRGRALLGRLRGVPPKGSVDFGDLRRLAPLDPAWGFGRGLPIDRVYIEAFLEAHARDIRGRVLEVGDAVYTRKFGGDRVEIAETVGAPGMDAAVDFAVDLAHGSGIPSDAFDCFVCTQTLQFLPDPAGALATARRILRPGGVLLLTVPALSRLAGWEASAWGDYWRFTDHGLRRALAPVFGGANIETAAYGNVLAAIAFLHGLAAEELEAGELQHVDGAFQILVGARAVKVADGPGSLDAAGASDKREGT